MKKTGLLVAVCAAILLSGCDFNFGFGESSTLKKEVTVKFDSSNIKCRGKLGSISSGDKVAKGTELTFTPVEEMNNHCVFKGGSRTIAAWMVDTKEQSFKDPLKRDEFSYTLGGSKDSITVSFTWRYIKKNITITYDDTKIACEKPAYPYDSIPSGSKVNEFTEIRIANTKIPKKQVVTEWQLKDSSGIISKDTPLVDFDQYGELYVVTKKATVNIDYKTRARKMVTLGKPSNIQIKGSYRKNDPFYVALTKDECYEGLRIWPVSTDSSKVIKTWTKIEGGETHTIGAGYMHIVKADALITVTYK